MGTLSPTASRSTSSTRPRDSPPSNPSTSWPMQMRVTLVRARPFFAASRSNLANYPPVYPDRTDRVESILLGLGLYPIPANASIEGTYLGCSVNDCNGDRHVIVVDNSTCLLYELYYSVPPSTPSGTWEANE